MKSEAVLELAKRRGFFWQGSALYNGVAGLFDYAPLGVRVKRKWEDLWRRHFLDDEAYVEIQPSLLMADKVFVASGHLEHFSDPLVKCGTCGEAERADHLLEDVLHENFEGLTVAELTAIVRKHGLKCRKCGGQLADAGSFNLMFPVTVGAGKQARTCYLTGETAQGAYVNFRQVFEVMRKKLPLGIAIVGKAFRNEIAPRQNLIRLREFTQAELQIFFDSETIGEHPEFSSVATYKLRLFPAAGRKKETETFSCKEAVEKLKLPKLYVYHLAKIQKFYLETLGVPKEKFRFRELSVEERAFYNKCHWDIEVWVESTGGFKEVGGLHYRTDHDLGGHGKVSGQDQTVETGGKKVLPHVLEVSMGVDRNFYALFELGLAEEDGRTVLRFPRALTPFDAAVFPLVSKDGLDEKAQEIRKLLADNGFTVFYDDGGSIGRRYRRIDEIGVAAGLTIDYDTKKDKAVTLRDRDTMKQVRVKIAELPDALKRFLDGAKLETIGKRVKTGGNDG